MLFEVVQKKGIKQWEAEVWYCYNWEDISERALSAMTD